jgi:hypothetical protein
MGSAQKTALFREANPKRVATQEKHKMKIVSAL